MLRVRRARQEMTAGFEPLVRRKGGRMIPLWANHDIVTVPPKFILELVYYAAIQFGVLAPSRWKIQCKINQYLITPLSGYLQLYESPAAI